MTSVDTQETDYSVYVSLCSYVASIVSFFSKYMYSLIPRHYFKPHIN